MDTILKSSSRARTDRVRVAAFAAFGLLLGMQGVSCALDEAPIGQLPIVFVPGTAGSELRFADVAEEGGDGDVHDEAVYWINPSALKPGKPLRGKLNDDGTDRGKPRIVAKPILMEFKASLFSPPPALAAFGVTANVAYTVPGYAKLHGWGLRKFDEDHWFEAPYDWRKGACHDNSLLLDAVVDRALRVSQQKKVILLAHSLGGLVCRDYIAGLGKTKVDSLIAVGTPWLGAPKAARGLVWGYNFGAGYLLRSLPKENWRSGSSPFISLKDPCLGPEPREFAYPTRISFIEPGAAMEIARTFPCVFQQLPTEEFMNLYAREADHPGRATSIFLGLSQEEALDLCASKNHPLFEEARKWREQHLRRDSFGVAHYLIAGVCEVGCDPSNIMDMQMANPERHAAQIENQLRYTREDLWKIPTNRAAIREHWNKLDINLRKETIRNLNGQAVYADPYVAVDQSTDWGDGTAPLLSATAGARVREKPPVGATAGAKAREKAPMQVAEAEKYLGPGVQVSAIKLDKAHGHADMLDDREVRNCILCIVRMRNP